MHPPIKAHIPLLPHTRILLVISIIWPSAMVCASQPALSRDHPHRPLSSHPASSSFQTSRISSSSSTASSSFSTSFPWCCKFARFSLALFRSLPGFFLPFFLDLPDFLLPSFQSLVDFLLTSFHWLPDFILPLLLRFTSFLLPFFFCLPDFHLPLFLRLSSFLKSSRCNSVHPHWKTTLQFRSLENHRTSSRQRKLRRCHEGSERGHQDADRWSHCLLPKLLSSPNPAHLQHVLPTLFKETWSFLIFVNIMAYTSSACNPLLYSVFSQKFRQKFQTLLACCRKKQCTPSPSAMYLGCRSKTFLSKSVKTTVTEI
ncbi:thyroliberin receptor [Caerostris extrusa]|uniref:Thyroliberin receptor n=1 Tax=Caerostris extrusa TaxID=172846 RepID=A0AAV4R3C6_CAEEX|nr:thyroliberin receptor [Caerostris extrusa]